MSSNYAKWDKWAKEVDSDSEEEKRKMKHPVVTRYDAPTSISIGPDGHGEKKVDNNKTASSQQPRKAGGLDYSKWDKVGEDISDEEDDDYEDGEAEDIDMLDQEELAAAAAAARVPLPPNAKSTTPSTAASTAAASFSSFSSSCPAAPAAAAATKPKANAKDESNSRVEDLTFNGGETSKYMWKQTASEVVVHVFVPVNTKASEVKVHVGGESENDYSKGDGRLRITVKGETILEGKIPYPILIDDSSEQETYSDWTLVDFDSTKRLLQLTLTKKNIAGIIVWWRRVLEGDAEIDVTLITGRKSGQQQGKNYKEAWDEAHRMFKEKIAGQKPVSLDFGNEEEEEEEGGGGENQREGKE